MWFARFCPQGAFDVTPLHRDAVSLNFSVSAFHRHILIYSVVFTGKNIFLASLYVVLARIFVGTDPGGYFGPSVRLPDRSSRPSREAGWLYQPKRPETGEGRDRASVSPHLLSPPDSLRSDHREELLDFFFLRKSNSI